MKVIQYIPTFAYLLLAFNILAFTGNTEYGILDSSLMYMPLISGATMALTWSHVLIILGVMFLYIEILKSTRTSAASVIDHALSMVVFVIFLVEFISVKKLGLASFFIVAIMSLVDVIAGFTVTITSARRDFTVGHPGDIANG